MKHIVLASASPRRHQLLADAGLAFSLAPPFEVDETPPPGMRAETVAEYLAELKSDACPLVPGPDEVILTADTTVVLEGTILGKPRDLGEAREMLRRLSGRTHRVITGVTLRTASHKTTFAATTDVTFRPLSPTEIDYYVDTFRPLDKAGAYGIQEWIGLVGVSRIEGSFHNVMGLPVQMIYTKILQL